MAWFLKKLDAACRAARRRDQRPGLAPRLDVRGPKKRSSGHRRRLSLRAWVLVLAGVVGVLLLMRLLGGEDVARLRGRAEAAGQAGDWATALELWRRINATVGATGATYLGEGRACLAQGLAAQAERALRQGCRAAPGESEAWLLLLEILRVEDRPLDAFTLGWEALDDVMPEARPELLRELTLAR